MTNELLECLHCGHKWKPNRLSNGFPKQCPMCKSTRWKEYPMRTKYLSECVGVYVSDKVYENLFRLKHEPHETFASVVDRLMENASPSVTIIYKCKPKPYYIKISTNSRDKLLEIKGYIKAKSLDEALWKVMG